MAWVYVKRKDKPQVHYITEEAYEQTFKEQGFEIVSNAENSDNVADKQVESETYSPRPKSPLNGNTKSVARHKVNGIWKHKSQS